MGWFSGDSKSDPVKNLEPGLRDYLEQEAPDRYVPGSSVKPSPSIPVQSPEPSEDLKPKVPAASLYQDGRYADLWKTYKPLTVDDGDKSGIRGASRVIEKHKEHGDTVQRAAMENCALEHETLANCFKTGNWRKQIEARLTMCSAENRTFSRCYTTQIKFLQALGYAASFEYDPEKEERLQMHADKLYHQMLDYEKRIEEAKAAGVEPPPLESLFHPQKKSNVQQDQGIEIPGGETIPPGFKPSKPLQKLTPHERELEIRAHNAQLQQRKLYVEAATPFMKSQDDTLQKRKEKTASWFGGTVGKWLS